MKLIREAVNHEFIHAVVLGVSGILTIVAFSGPMLIGLEGTGL